MDNSTLPRRRHPFRRRGVDFPLYYMCPVFVCLQYLNVDSAADAARPHSAPGTSGMINLAYQDAMADPRPKCTPSGMSSDSLSLSMCSNMEGSQALNVSGFMDSTGGSRQPTPTSTLPLHSLHPPPHSTRRGAISDYPYSHEWTFRRL